MMAAFVPALSAEDVVLESSQDKVSYLIGRNIVESISGDGLDLKIETLVFGLKEAIAGTESKISEQDAQAVMMAFQAEMQQKMAEQAAVAAKENLAAGEAFLTENKTREGVITTESGLQYEVLTAGEGAKPSESDTVSVHYHGTLINGNVFDSSVDRGEPVEFPVTGVIPGWVEALQLMPAGSKYKLFIPANLAYGEQGSGGGIGPNETLIFEVELLAIKSAETPVEAEAGE